MNMFLKTFLKKRSSYPPQEKEAIKEKVRLAQEGNQEVRNLLIQESQKFVSQVTSKVCKRYIVPSRDDEFSVGLIAFDEAIMHYTEEKGSSFLSFADLVIRRRVIDYIRKQARHGNQLSLEYWKEGEAEGDLSPIDIKASLQHYELEQEAIMRREEILHYKDKLKEFNIELSELPNISPKHADARRNAFHIARTLVNNAKLRLLFIAKGKLPIKELLSYIMVSRKTVERNRVYIVAIVLLLMEDYQFLQGYIEGLHDMNDIQNKHISNS